MEERFAATAGIKPTKEWLDACTKCLTSQQSPTYSSSDEPCQEEEILHQILHTDLRNVVRHVPRSDDHTTIRPEERLQQPNMGLRHAIQTSRTLPPDQMSSAKATLPPSFRCMIQIEEFLDVSTNAHHRLTLGPTSRTAPTAIGNQHFRCLKMVVSDGYYSNGLGVGDALVEDSSEEVLVAVETVPIPQLSVHSHPGIKVILNGPLEVRLGILMLHPGNTTVVGGCIPGLIPVQKKAVELAARLAGVGVGR